MKLILNLRQVQEAIATYVNAQKLVNIEVKPEHVEPQIVVTGEYDMAQYDFDGVVINLSKSEGKT